MTGSFRQKVKKWSACACIFIYLASKNGQQDFFKNKKIKICEKFQVWKFQAIFLLLILYKKIYINKKENMNVWLIKENL